MKGGENIMTNLKTKITSAVATAGLLATSFAPMALADTTITVQGNGADSNNTVDVKDIHKSSVKQKNDTTVSTVVSVDQNTGGNKANKNTGGDTEIKTGNATSTVMVDVSGNSNEATAGDCECVDHATDVDVKNNGADSDNDVTVKNKSKSKVKQKNTTTVATAATVKQKTGKNKAKKNTDGNVTVTTGNANSTVDVTVDGGENTLN
jgi:hypothetical protein